MSGLCEGDDGLCPESAEADGYCDKHHPSATKDRASAAVARFLAAADPEVWDAINEYAVACGGRPDRYVYGNTKRQKAVARVERAIAERIRAARGEGGSSNG